MLELILRQEPVSVVEGETIGEIQVLQGLLHDVVFDRRLKQTGSPMSMNIITCDLHGEWDLIQMPSTCILSHALDQQIPLIFVMWEYRITSFRPQKFFWSTMRFNQFLQLSRRVRIWVSRITEKPDSARMRFDIHRTMTCGNTPYSLQSGVSVLNGSFPLMLFSPLQDQINQVQEQSSNIPESSEKSRYVHAWSFWTPLCGSQEEIAF